jgi:hypothetical protein
MKLYSTYILNPHIYSFHISSKIIRAMLRMYLDMSLFQTIEDKTETYILKKDKLKITMLIYIIWIPIQHKTFMQMKV